MDLFLSTDIGCGSLFRFNKLGNIIFWPAKSFD